MTQHLAEIGGGHEKASVAVAVAVGSASRHGGVTIRQPEAVHAHHHLGVLAQAEPGGDGHEGPVFGVGVAVIPVVVKVVAAAVVLEGLLLLLPVFKRGGRSGLVSPAAWRGRA